MSGKYFLWHSNNSLWARSQTSCLEAKMRSLGFQASTKRSHPMQPGSAFRTFRHWVLSGCRRMAFLRALRRGSGSVVYLNLFVIVGMLTEPVVWHFSGDWGRLPLVAAADDLDAPTQEPAEEGSQNGAGHCADLVPDDHTGNEFLSHPLGRPVCLATLAEEAVIGLGLDAPGPHLFGQTVGRGEDEGVSGTEELHRSRGFAAAPTAV